MTENHYVYRSYEPLGRSYIGSRTCKCPIEDDSYMGSYTDKTFSPTQKEILAICETRKEALRTEMFFHEMYDVARSPMFANRAKQTGTGFTTQGTTPSEETRQKLSEAKSGENNPMFGKNHAEETRQKISEAKIGENNPQFGKTGEDSSRFGKTHTEEAKQKIGKASKGRIPSEETRQKIREKSLGSLWYVNSTGETCFCQNSPGPEWQRGRKWREI